MASKKYIPIDKYLETMFFLDTGDKFTMYPHFRKVLLEAFTLGKDGKLPYRMFIYSARKKSCKTTLAAGIASWYMFGGLRQPNDQVYFACNSLEQSMSRGYEMLRTSIVQNPLLFNQTVKCHTTRIELKDGTYCEPVANNYAGVAGSNPSMCFFDEIWGFETPASRHLWDELVPSPTRDTQMRIVTTYAGFVGESLLLEEIYKKIVREENRISNDLPIYRDGKTLAFWSSSPSEVYFPWHTPDWFEEHRNEPGQTHTGYARIYQNQWVSSETGLDPKEWDRCEQLGAELGHKFPPAPDRNLYLAVGIDAGLKRDRAAVTTVFKKDGKIWLGPRKFWQPSGGQALNLEDTIEAYVRELCDKYTVLAVYYDPWQFVRSAQTLERDGAPMCQYDQTKPKLVKLATNMLDLMRYGKLVLYPDVSLREEALMVSLKEVPECNGVRFIKDSDSKKIDSFISLAMACLAAVENIPDDRDLSDQFLILKR